MTELYFDCSMGAAGDMLSAALFELFPQKDKILNELNSAGIPGVIYKAENKKSCGISGTHMRVLYEGREERQGDTEEYSHHHHSLKDIKKIVESLSFPQKVKNDIINVYTIIARAESQVHGEEMENIHFHELGTMDALADISAVSYMIYLLKPAYISASPVRLGCGFVKCAHGIMPVPAPATAVIIKSMEVYGGDIEGEMCTPTGAALLKYFVNDFSALPPMKLISTGAGLGTKEFCRPNAVRAFLGESENEALELCCNLDDMSPEAIGFALQRLLEEGALDVWYECIGMKKFRPGITLHCLCTQDKRDKMLELIFKHTSTIGIREALCRRYVLKRRNELLESPYGKISVKISEAYGIEKKKAEFEQLAAISRSENISIAEICERLEI